MTAQTALPLEAPASASLTVAEVFGPTFQGEGPSTGQRAVFLRLGGCNLSCKWCDTPYTWDWLGRNGTKYSPRVELHRMGVEDAAATINALASPAEARLVVTGGEPLLQGDALTALLSLVRHRVEVETNGTQAPPLALAVNVDQWNVSPKLAHSGLTVRERRAPAAIELLAATGRANWKYVARHDTPDHIEDDLAEIAAMVEGYRLDPRRVWVMPEGRSVEAIVAGMRALAQPVLDRGWHLSTRMHVLIWGDERGR